MPGACEENSVGNMKQKCFPGFIFILAILQLFQSWVNPDNRTTQQLLKFK